MILSWAIVWKFRQRYQVGNALRGHGPKTLKRGLSTNRVRLPARSCRRMSLPIAQEAARRYGRNSDSRGGVQTRLTLVH